MSSLLLLALLGITFLWPPRMQALRCQFGTFETVMNRSEQFFSWTTGEIDCPSYQPACQDTMLFIENGPLMKVVLLKDCTSAPLQERNVTIYRADPGLSFLSYTHVCNEDLCNDLSSTYPLWDQVPPSVPGSMQCPFCLSENGCLSPPMITCPVETEHCYDGLLQLEGASIHHKLRIQGCQVQPGCDLLNGTKEVGPLSLKEVCNPNALLTCYQGTGTAELEQQESLRIPWVMGDSVLCNVGEVCQETLLLIASVTKAIFMGSKDCAKPNTQLSRSVQVHTRSPGVLIASYSHFCNKSGCNDASSSAVLLDQLPNPDHSVPKEASGNMECPDCVGTLGQCPKRPNAVNCPKNSSHCYHGLFKVIGGKVNWDISVQGCADQPSQKLLNTDLHLGPFLVFEDEEDDIINKAVPIHCVAWVVGLALLVALWQGGPSSP